METSEAYQKASAYCAYQDRCRAEVREKLEGWGLPPDQAAQVIEQLEAEGFIDEARFARLFAGGKFRSNKWGRLKIKHALRLKQVAAAHIASALAELDEEEYMATLRQLAASKKPDKAKLPAAFRFLVGKGYEPELVRQVLMGKDEE